jgi:hypothetical protein
LNRVTITPQANTAGGTYHADGNILYLNGEEYDYFIAGNILTIYFPWGNQEYTRI